MQVYLQFSEPQPNFCVRKATLKLVQGGNSKQSTVNLRTHIGHKMFIYKNSYFCIRYTMYI